MKRAIVAVSVFALAMFGDGPAWADPATAARANAYGVDVGGSLLGSIIERTPEVTSVLPPGGLVFEDILPVDADPVALSITGRVVAETQEDSVIESFELLKNPSPVNAQGLADIESLDVVLEGAEVVDPVDELERDALVSADAVFAEAVGVCQGTTPAYSTDSDVVNLRIAGGQEVQLVDGVADGVIGLVDNVGALLSDALQIHIETDESGTTTDGVRFVNALRITVGPTQIDPEGGGEGLLGILDPGALLGTLAPASAAAASPAIAEPPAEEEMFAIAQVADEPLIDITLAHAEVGGLTCPGDTTTTTTTTTTQPPGGNPECSDGIDNDGDGLIDFPADPGCDSPQDDDERNQCIDGIDNDGDGLIDFGPDPGCDSPQDNDERNQCIDGIDNDGDGLIDFGPDPGCDSPQDNDERDGLRAAGGPRLPRTGGGLTAPLAGLSLLALAGAAEALRRRTGSS